MSGPSRTATLMRLWRIRGKRSICGSENHCNPNLAQLIQCVKELFIQSKEKGDARRGIPFSFSLRHGGNAAKFGHAEEI